MRSAGQVKPYRVVQPCEVAFDLTSATLADICATIPAATRQSALTVGFKAGTIGDAIRWMAVCAMLGSHLR